MADHLDVVVSHFTGCALCNNSSSLSLTGSSSYTGHLRIEFFSQTFIQVTYQIITDFSSFISCVILFWPLFCVHVDGVLVDDNRDRNSHLAG